MKNKLVLLAVCLIVLLAVTCTFVHESPSLSGPIRTELLTATDWTVSWQSQPGNGQCAYKVYLNDQFQGIVFTPMYSFSGLKAGTLYSARIEAMDTRGSTVWRSSAQATTGNLLIPVTQYESYTIGCGNEHRGVDFFGSPNTPCRAAGKGIYRSIIVKRDPCCNCDKDGSDNGYILIELSNPIRKGEIAYRYIWYQHLNGVVDRDGNFVSQAEANLMIGTTVEAGQMIGTIGHCYKENPPNSGKIIDSPHLHFGITSSALDVYNNSIFTNEVLAFLGLKCNPGDNYNKLFRWDEYNREIEYIYPPQEFTHEYNVFFSSKINIYTLGLIKLPEQRHVFVFKRWAAIGCKIDYPESTNAVASEFMNGLISENGALPLSLAVPAYDEIPVPELSCGDIRVTPPVFYSNGLYTFVVNVQNNGSAPASDVEVSWDFDGVKKTTKVDAPIPPNGSRSVSCSWTSTAGPHWLTIRVDPENTIVEMNDENNTCVMPDFYVPVKTEPPGSGETPAPGILPDLICDRIIAPEKIVAGQTAVFAATVWNTGSGYTGGIKVAWYIDGLYAGESLIGNVLAPNSSAGAAFNVVLSEGSHSISNTVDPYDNIKELLETNNDSPTVSFTAEQGLPPETTPHTVTPEPTPATVDLSCSQIIGPGTVGIGTACSFSVFLENKGNVTSVIFSYEWKCDGMVIMSDYGVCNPSSPLAITCPWTANALPGDHAITFSATTLNGIEDSNPLDNTVSKTVFVDRALVPEERDIVCFGLSAPDSIGYGEDCTFSAIVTNNSLNACNNFSITWMCDTQLIPGESSIESLDSGASRTIYCKWTANVSAGVDSAHGNHVIKVAVIVDTSFGETNITNNSAIGEIHVRPSGLYSSAISGDSPVLAGSNNLYSAFIRNDGIFPCNNFYVVWTCDGKQKSLIENLSLSAGASRTFTLLWDAPILAGSHTIKVTASCPVSNTEYTDLFRNNTATKLVEVINGNLDLSCSEIRGPLSVYISDTNTYSATITNMGNVISGLSSILWECDGSQFKTEEIPSLDAGESTDVWCIWVANASYGNHTIKLMVEPPESVMDINPSNNSSSINVFVDSTPPEPTPIACNISCTGIDGPDTVYMAQTYTYRIDVTNTGSVTCVGSVNLLVDGTQAASTSVTLPSFYSGTAFINWTANVGRGDHTLSVKIGSETCASKNVFADVPPEPTEIPCSFICSGITGESAVYIGRTYNYSVTLSNPGGTTCALNVSWLSDGSAFSSTNIAVVAGASTTISCSWTANVSYGNHTISVDIGGASCATLSIFADMPPATSAPTLAPTTPPSPPPTAAPAPASFTCSGASGPSTLKMGSSYTHSTSVSNTGGSSGSVTVTLLVDGSTKATKTVSLNAGASASVSITWTCNVSMGNHTLSFKIDTSTCGSMSFYAGT